MTPDEENLIAAEKLLELAGQHRPSGRLPATKDDVRAVQNTVETTAASEKFVTWISSGVGALASILGVAAILVGAAWFLLGQADARGESGGRKGVEAAAVVQKNLDEHKQFEASNHAWNQTMMLRMDDRLADLSEGRHNRSIAPPPAPPALYLPDGGPR